MIRDIEKQNQLENDGYTIINLLNNNQIDCIKKIYKKEKPLFNSHHTYCNIFSSKYEKNLRIENQIRNIIDPILLKNFANTRFIGGCFLVKNPSKHNEVALHQDWKITEEDIYQSYNIWIPLVDVNIDNGTMFLLEKSHIHFNNATRSYDNPSEYIPLDDELGRKAISVKLKAGEALIYSSSLFHGSSANRSKEERPVVILSCCDENARLCYYYYDKRQDLTYQLERPLDFHLKYFNSIKNTRFNEIFKVISIIKGKQPNYSYSDIRDIYISKG